LFQSQQLLSEWNKGDRESWIERQGKAYQWGRSVISKEGDVGGQMRVTGDELQVL